MAGTRNLRARGRGPAASAALHLTYGKLLVDVCNSHSTWALMQSLIDTDTMAHNCARVQCGAGPTYY